jgi:hypothetical protein
MEQLKASAGSDNLVDRPLELSAAAEQRGTFPLYQNFPIHADAVRSQVSARMHVYRHKA